MKRQRAKFSALKGHEPLIGNSGCKLRIFKDKLYKVRKESTNKINSNRLFSQYIKTLKFNNYRNISVPRIYLTGKKKKLFYFDMEYINGSTLSLYLMSQPISLTYKIIDEIIEFILNCRSKNLPKYNDSIFLKKINDLKTKKIFSEKFFFKVINTLEKYNWKNIEKSFSHGDLSLENIIIKNNEIKFIDVSENFIESYKLDASKIMFDLICFWSFRKIELQVDPLKIYSLKKYLLEVFSKKLSKQDLKDIKMLIILDFLRVLHYTKNIKDINILKKKLKNFYDNINNPVRW